MSQFFANTVKASLSFFGFKQHTSGESFSKGQQGRHILFEEWVWSVKGFLQRVTLRMTADGAVHNITLAISAAPRGTSMFMYPVEAYEARTLQAFATISDLIREQRFQLEQSGVESFAAMRAIPSTDRLQCRPICDDGFLEQVAKSA